MESVDCNAVKIAVRERPLRDEYKIKSEDCIYYPLPNGNTLIINERPFTLDHVFRPQTTQKEVYDAVVKPLVAKALQGFNCTALAYGQTGSGKSYTMGLNFEHDEDENIGVIPRCFKEVFSRIELNNENLAKAYEISASFIEIYNEKVYDLLNENFSEPVLAKGCKFNGSTKVPLKNIDECYELVRNANKNRRVRPTKMNAQSSRSHAIFSIHFQMEKNSECLTSCLNFVDLAGSEGVKRTGHEGLARSEGVFINQGLLSIGKVVQAMSMGSKVIPYRDSVLSTVLQDSLNVNSYLTLLACISPHRQDLSETLSTLRFAQSAKQLKHNPQINNILAEIKKTKLAAKAKLSQALTPFKRPLSQNNQKKPTLSSTGQDGKHSNTFSTPTRAKRSSEYNRCNQSDLGYTPKEKLKTLSRITKPSIPEFLTTQESSFERSLSIRSSLSSSNSTIGKPETIQPVSYSPLVRKCLDEFDSRLEAKLLKVMESICSKEPPIFQTPFTMNPNPVLPNSTDDSPIISSNLTRTASNTCRNFATSSPVKDFLSSNQPLVDNIYSEPIDKPSTTRRSTRINSSIAPANSTVSDLYRNRHNKTTNPPVRKSMRILERSLHIPSTSHEHTEGANSLNSTQSKRRRRAKSQAPTTLTSVAEDTQAVETKRTKTKIQNKIIQGYIDTKSRGMQLISLSNHRKAILDMLNKGSMKDIQILPQIGKKIAFQIISYRSVNGQFKSLKQVEKLPIWRGTAWQRFSTANMLN